MTRKPLFIESTKDFIAQHIVNKTMTPTQLANHFGCHPRSINRVMEERGLSAITSKGNGKNPTEASRIKKMLAEAGITADALAQLLMQLMAANLTNPDHLKNVLAHHVITPTNVQRYLDGCTKEQLATHFYASGLIKLAEISQKIMDRKAQTAALFKAGAQVQNTAPTDAAAATA